MDLNELKKVTTYDKGYKNDDPTVRHFWEVRKFLGVNLELLFQTHYLSKLFQVLEDYSQDLQKKFLLFTTGSDRVPVGGMGEMSLKITRMTVDGRKRRGSPLPEAHTCFNQLVLPDYRDKELLKKKLTIAISNAEGFGLE